MPMHIAGEEINFTYNSLEIYVSGCTRNCPGCQNPELQQYGVGKKWQRWLRDNKYMILNACDGLVDKIWIVGGDLLCQPVEDAVEFLKALHKANRKLQIIVWSGEDEIMNVNDEIFENCDGLKLGHYEKKSRSYEADYCDPKKGDTTVTLASNNQAFYFKDGTEIDTRN